MNTKLNDGGFAFFTVTLNLKGAVRTMSPNLPEILDRKIKPGQNITEIFPETLGPAVIEVLKQNPWSDPKRSFLQEVALPRMKNSLLAVSANLLPLDDPDQVMLVGRATRIDTVNNVGPKKLQKIIERVANGIIVERDGKILFVNDAFIQMFNVSSVKDCISDYRLEDFIMPYELERVSAVGKARLAGKEAPEAYDAHFRTADGEGIWVNVRATNMEWDGDIATVAVLDNVSRRVIAEQEARRSQQIMAKIIATVPQGLIIYKADTGLIRTVNDGAISLTGYKVSEMVEKPVQNLPIWSDQEDEDIAKTLLPKGDKGNPTYYGPLETKIQQKNGETLPVSVHISDFWFEDEHLAIALIQDLGDQVRQRSELRRSKEAAERASRTKSEFLANVSHELRTPLNAILGFSEMIEGELFGPHSDSRYHDYASHIHESGQHLLGVINDLLDLSKIEAGKFELNPERAVVKELVEPAMALLRENADAVGIKTVLEIANPDAILMVDILRTRQVMINLISNAVKSTETGGTVTAGARKVEKGKLALFVSDTGVGMSERDIQKALEPFGQVGKSSMLKGEGTGLGLPLAKALIELQGGEFNIISEPGKGTEVTATFPIEK